MPLHYCMDCGRENIRSLYCGRDDSLLWGAGTGGTSLIIHDPLMPQLLQELADVGANLSRIGISELRL
jgi:hypothetical protein